MTWLKNKKVQYALAGLGVIYLVLFIGFVVTSAVKKPAATGPSELEAHPELQDEIRAARRLEDMKERLKLSDEQVQQVAELFAAQQATGGGPGGGPGGPGGPAGFMAMREKLQQILTPEQQQLMMQMGPFGRGRGGPGGQRGPGGPMNFMTDERAESLRQQMTPEQQERFDKKYAEFQQRRAQMEARRAARGNQAGPQGAGASAAPPAGGGEMGPPPDGGGMGPPPDGAGGGEMGPPPDGEAPGPPPG